ncbi:hypothetical protein KUTeg_020507 [Tegillarca granosa]|uniref:alpha-L-fucosidase n=1 Tax=Tegillarca granosa TaxID=220873 RepID=A0ABQ9E8L3_TEGGR|nr:hypothetical protein KUTeg_020507 [Tegillarca granosa]
MAYVSKFITYIFILFVAKSTSAGTRYDPNWASIDSRPLPTWYDEGKIGIFINWGVYSVPSFNNEWFWYRWKGPKKTPEIVEFMEKNYRPDFQYQDFAEMLTAEFYNPKEWVEVFKASGAKYVINGYINTDVIYLFIYLFIYFWGWAILKLGSSFLSSTLCIQQSTMKVTPCIHLMYHGIGTQWMSDQTEIYLLSCKYKTIYERRSVYIALFQRKTMPELYEIVNRYKPDVIWSDGDWEAPDVYWNSTEFIAWLYNDSPVKETVVTNDRWGGGIICHHGGFMTCSDRYNPGVLQKRKWENAMTIDKYSWGFRREAKLEDFFTIEDLIALVIKTVSCGGNILINIGPTHDGRIVPIYEERLRQLGAWLSVNGEGIYQSKPWTYQNDSVTPDIWYTSKKTESSINVFDWLP